MSISPVKRPAENQLKPPPAKAAKREADEEFYLKKVQESGIHSPFSQSRFKRACNMRDRHWVALQSSPHKAKAPRVDIFVAEQEIAILKELQGGPHIPRVREAFSIPGKRYTIIEQRLGQDLFDAYLNATNPDRAPLYVDDLARIGHWALDALEYLHRKNVLHADIKPENLSVDGYLFDFGTAEILKKISSQGFYTTSQVNKGSPNYWPPERSLIGKLFLTSDLWALGCTLFVLATQKNFLPPYTSKNPDQNEINQLHAYQQRLNIYIPLNPRIARYFDPQGKLKPSTLAPLPYWKDAFSHFKNPSTGTFYPQVELLIDLMEKLLNPAWDERITATEALQHPLFTGPLSSDISFHLDLPQDVDLQPLDLRVIDEKRKVIFTTSLYHWIPSSCYHIPKSEAPYLFEIFDRDANQVLCALEYTIQSDNQRLAFPLFNRRRELNVCRELFPENPV